MTSLFEPTQAGDIALANRIAMAPLTRNRSPEAIPTDLVATYYAQRASAGLIISEATAISPQGQGYADVPGLYGTEQLDGWKKVTRAVHQAGGKIVVQLWHVGRISHTSLQPGNAQPVAPSAIRAHAKTVLIKDGVPTFTETSEPRALDAQELPGIVQDYRHAARNAIAAGFDGVEVHGAHGYLIDAFLRDGSNKREDAYGGSIENRARFLLEIMSAVTQEIGADRVGIRISPVSPVNDSSESQPQPLFEYVVRELNKIKPVYIHVVEGATGGPRDNAPFDYDALRSLYDGVWMLNNGYTKDMAEAAPAEGRGQLVSFGRLMITNPDLPRRFKENAPLNEMFADAPLYGGIGPHGYIDYPSLPA